MAFEPAINLPFHRAAGSFILGDPRMSIVRASTGQGINRLGRSFTVPPNTLRPRFHPLTGVCEGFHVERTTTNLLLHSQAFNTTWTATSLTVAADSTIAPDGTTTADTITATGAGGNVAQAITVAVGRGISVSVHGKPLAASFLWVQVGDGSNAVECWFNLSAGTTGANTAGTATCVFSQKAIEPHALGFWRCMLDVNTATSTSFTVKFGPAASDGAQPANTNSIYVWGGQGEAELNISAATSYIPTTTATVTRSAENIHLPIDSAWFIPNEGTLVFELVNRYVPNGVPGSHVVGGVSNSFNDVIYLSRIGTSTMQATFAAGGVSAAQLTRTWNFTPGAIAKCAVAWAQNDMAFVVDGGAAAISTASFTPPTFARIGLGCAPWSTSDNGNKPGATLRAFKYIPRRAPTVDMQALTAA
jgi:hypothetical protein